MADINRQGMMSGAATGASVGGPWGALAGGVLGGFMSGDDPSEAARQAAAQNLAFQQQMYQQQDPFSAGGNRQQYVAQLNTLMAGGPQSLANDPSMQWLRGQTRQGTEAQQSAAGSLHSGGGNIDMAKSMYGTTMDYFNQQYNRLASLSGASSGRTTPMQGMSAGDAYNLASGPYQANMGFLSAMTSPRMQSSWSNLFGQGGGSSLDNPSRNVQGNSDYYFDV